MSEWRVAHETLSRLARERAAADAVEGQWLLRARRARRAEAHVHLGFGSFVSYVEQLFGYTPRSISEKLRAAEALEQLPASRAALEQGRLGWCAARGDAGGRERNGRRLVASRTRQDRARARTAGRGQAPGTSTVCHTGPARRALRAALGSDGRSLRAVSRGAAGATSAELELFRRRSRSEGGSHSADNLVTLCSVHHRALHRGELRGAGDASDFRVLPGVLGVALDGGAPHPPSASSSLDVSARVASGLRQLGFRAAEVHAVIAELRQQNELAAAGPQQWLREALRHLHPAPARPR